ncbi:DUF2784 domain-containing protein [uncultured Mucilaginibacter sp.]|uniref:DUF2784 domain-containing protein n=1 Tax=uncultured Mucilaginibacter sp. TaxID=797541 RepID=UPI0026367729|nr:DUF2784 domain-containing protein [uncultured Mucilaginibacter sp.]
MNLRLLDLLLTLFHLLVIGFNLFGWIWRPTRKLHLICILVTALCWFGLGIWYGIGYCPMTDYQWHIKELRGEQNLPNSFIKYMVDAIFGSNINATLIDVLTGLGFFLAALLSVYVNFFRKIDASFSTK